MLQNDKLARQEDVVYFGRKASACGSVVHSGDNLTGDGDGDDEVITINLSAVPAQFNKLVFVVNIYEAQSRQQHFGMIRNAYIRVLEPGTNNELIRYNLSEDYQNQTALITGKFIVIITNGNSVQQVPLRRIRSLAKSVPDLHNKREVKMVISLAKGQKVDLTKTNPGLQK